MAPSMIILISDQAIPNLLGVLKFRPEKVFMLHSREGRFVPVMHNLTNYLTRVLSGIEIIKLEVPANDPDSVINKCLDVRSMAGDNIVVINATCGTKLMALGAFRAGLEAGMPVIYVDTEQEKFLDLGRVKADLPGGHGLPFLKVDDFLGVFGAKIEEEKTSWILKNKDRFFPLAKYMVSENRDWRELQEYFHCCHEKLKENIEFRGPLVAIQNAGKKRLCRCNIEALKAYEKAGVIDNIRILGSEISFRFPDEKTRDFFALRKGTLLELYTFYSIQQIKGVQDVRGDVSYCWGGNVKNEIDVIASVGPRLICISCKSGKPKTHFLMELESNAGRLGGTFVKKIFVMGESIAKYPDFNERASKMSIKIIDLDQLREYGHKTFQEFIFNNPEG